jgi:hypothetical protein
VFSSVRLKSYRVTPEVPELRLLSRARPHRLRLHLLKSRRSRETNVHTTSSYQQLYHFFQSGYLRLEKGTQGIMLSKCSFTRVYEFFPLPSLPDNSCRVLFSSTSSPSQGIFSVHDRLLHHLHIF